MARGTAANWFQAVIGVAGVVGLALSAAPPRLAAQAVIGEIPTASQTIAGVGDVNGDGHADIVAGLYSVAAGAGVVRIYSGADGSVLHEWGGDVPGMYLGERVDSVDDADGDGLDDVLAGAGNADVYGHDAGLVRLYSSGTGALLGEIPGLAADDHFGAVIAGVGDLDGDGSGDFAGGYFSGTGSGGVPGAGYARFISGADGHEFAQVHGGGVGYSLSPAGDFDNDGTPDVAVGARFEFGTTHILVYSGAWIVHGTPPAVLLDYSDGDVLWSGAADSIGDLDQDGWDDLLVGTPGLGQDCFPPPCPRGGWRVLSGQDHSVLSSWIGPGDLYYGARVAAADDLDQDGSRDFLVAGEAFLLPAHVLGFSGRTGALLYSCGDSSSSLAFGAGLASLGDVNADGWPDWAVSGGEAIVLYSPAGIWNDLGHGLPGTMGVPTLSGAGLLLGSDAMSVTLAGTPPHQPFVLVIGLSAVNLPFHGGVFVPDAGLLLFDVTDAGGGRQWSTTWPQIASAQSFYFQAWMLDPQAGEGWAASNGLRAQSP